MAGRSAVLRVTKVARTLPSPATHRSVLAEPTIWEGQCCFQIPAPTVGSIQQHLPLRLPAVGEIVGPESSTVPIYKLGISLCASNSILLKESMCAFRRTCSMPLTAQTSDLRVSLLQRPASAQLPPPGRRATFSSASS